MNKVRHYCVNCRENGEEDDNIVHELPGRYARWTSLHCEICGSEAIETEEVPEHTPDPRDEPIGHDFHREMHEYRVQKGEIEE